MKVELLDHMGDDLAVANAARVSMDKESGWWCGIEGDLADRDAKLITYLARAKPHPHWTPFAHTAVKLRVKAPIFLARQLFKHKVGLVENEVSRRYVDSQPEFYTPDLWRKKVPNVKQGSSKTEVVSLVHDQFDRSYTPHVLWLDHQLAALELYTNMLEAGICAEQARLVLPQGMMTEWIWTGSVASFARVCKQRSDEHAQYEAQVIARMIGDLIEPLFPVSWKALQG